MGNFVVMELAKQYHYDQRGARIPKPWRDTYGPAEIISPHRLLEEISCCRRESPEADKIPIVDRCRRFYLYRHDRAVVAFDHKINFNLVSVPIV